MTAHERLICISMDAMRLSLRLPTRNFTKAEIIRWLKAA